MKTREHTLVLVTRQLAILILLLIGQSVTVASMPRQADAVLPADGIGNFGLPDAPGPTQAELIAAGPGAWLVTWTTNASGSIEYEEFDIQKIKRTSYKHTGYAIFRPVMTYPNHWSGDLLKYSVVFRGQDDLILSACMQTHQRSWITDPARHVDESDTSHSVVLPRPVQLSDGSWIMREPKELIMGDTLNLSWHRRWETRWEDCIGRQGYSVSEGEGGGGIGPCPVHNLEGNASGTLFTTSYECTYQAGFHDVPVKIQRTIRVVELGYCIGQTGPLDANSPIINDLTVTMAVDKATIPPNKSNTLNPPNPATFSVKVTCEGVPVKNAQLRVEVNAQENSGGHRHTNGANPRPRGYLKGPGMSDYVEITEQQPYLLVSTDSQGMAKIAFRPGTDYNTGGSGNCVGKRRGIAGTYDVKATVMHAKIKDRSDQRSVIVQRTDFVPLPSGEHYFRKYNSTIHPEGTWGTQPTMDGIQALANAFYDYQVQHNQVLIQAGKTPWPIVDIGIIDISLQDGGLYDSGGTNVCGGGVQVGFIPWQIPHQTHLKGTGVDISTNAVTWPGTEARRNWWRSALRGLGCFYGRWAPESTLHLDVDQNASNWGQMHPNCQYSLPDLALQSMALNSKASGPNLFVNVMVSTPDDDSYELPIAAPGQLMTYTVGVNNLLDTSEAHQVVLTVTLPNGLQFLSADPPVTRMGSTGQPVWDVGTLATQASLQTFSLVTQIENSIAPGTLLTVTAEATSPDSERMPDDHGEAALLVTSPGPDLVIQPEGLEGMALTLGQSITTTFDIINRGTSIAPNMMVTFTLPPSVTLRSAAPMTTTAGPNGLLTWSLGTLAPGALQRITVSLKLDWSLVGKPSLDPEVDAGGPLTFTLSATTSDADIDPTNNTQTIIKSVALVGGDLKVWMGVDGTDADTGKVIAGQVLTYTLHYGNYGNQVVPITTLTLTLGSGLSLIGTQPAATRTASERVAGWNLGDLPVGQNGSIEVQVRVGQVPQWGSWTTASINGARYDIAPSNNVVQDLRMTISPGLGFRIYLPTVVR